MSPQVLRKIAELVRAGATVLGPRPERAPGLTDPPQADEEVRRLAADLWGEVDGKTSTERKVGDGRIIQGRGIEEVLRADSLPPDFECRGQPDARIEHVHRTAPEAEIYFVSNQRDREEVAECAFRVSGRPAEIWDPTSGDIRGALGCRDDGARTWLPIRFAPRQSWFVVFPRPAAGGTEPTSARKAGSSFPALAMARTIEGPWQVSFDPRWGGPEAVAFERLEDWTKRPEEGIRYYSGTATYRRTFDLGEGPPAEGARTFLDLGTVHHLAAVRLNGKDLGVVWTAPWRVEVTGILQSSGNELEVDVVNLWPNRLIGDARLPPEKRFTVTNVGKFQADSPLVPSGLIGPVTLQVDVGAR
jgi:hypothetical protein